MKLTYADGRNVAYLQLREKTGDLQTVVVGDELNVDLLPDGTVFGIELLNAAEQLGLGAEQVTANVSSTAIQRVDYDEDSRELVVTFRNGKTYAYLDVPGEVYGELLDASSVGTYVNTRIKPRFEVRPVTDQSAA